MPNNSRLQNLMNYEAWEAARSLGCHLQSERTTANNPNSAERTLTRAMDNHTFSILCEMTQLRSNNTYDILADAASSEACAANG